MSPIRCPECWQIIEHDAARKHALSHWDEDIKDIPENKGARARQKVLLDFASKTDEAKPKEGGG